MWTLKKKPLLCTRRFGVSLSLSFSCLSRDHDDADAYSFGSVSVH